MGKIQEKIKQFYFGPLINSFSKEARFSLEEPFPKQLVEISAILKVGSSLPHPPSLLDVGGGVGVNAAVLKQVFGYNCTVIDRLVEFSPEHNRVMGDAKTVVSRLENFGVRVTEHDFVKDGFPFKPATFDMITCFNVIEHFNFSPKDVISGMAKMLKPGGVLLLSTPNQAHLYNRVKLLSGKNVWEDFEYYYSAVNFWGHVREFLPNELECLMSREETLTFDRIIFSNYPVEDKINRLRARIGYVPSELLRLLIDLVVMVAPKLNYYMIAIAHKNH